nr:unnamed protein product [Spirometra erinaceieuropaei]
MNLFFFFFAVAAACVFAPTLFSLIFSVMLMDVYHGKRHGTRITYRTDGHLLNQWLMHFQSRVSTTIAHELLFTDDCALKATSEGDMKRSMDLFTAAYDKFGLVINMEETVAMHPLSSDATYVAPQTNVNGAQLQVVDNFTCLDSVLSRCPESCRIPEASQAFGRLLNTV